MVTNAPGTIIPLRPTGRRFDPPASHRTLRLVTQYITPGMFVLLIAIGVVTFYLEQWLWMKQLLYTGIFRTMFSVQWTMYIASFAIVFSLVWLNLRQAGLMAAFRAVASCMPRARSWASLLIASRALSISWRVR